MKMKSIMCYFLVASLQIMSSISVTANRPSPPYAASQQEQIPRFPRAASDSEQSTAEFVPASEETYKVPSRLGSRPPSCNHRCEGCMPCDAIQIPATSDQMRLHYANYEPEGWKCKCGSSFYNP